jgi:hypothetical protein
VAWKSNWSKIWRSIEGWSYEKIKDEIGEISGYILASKKFEWELNKSYKIKVKAIKNEFSVYVEDKELIRFVDDDNCYYKGQVGFSNLKGAHTQYNYLKVKSIDL